MLATGFAAAACGGLNTTAKIPAAPGATSSAPRSSDDAREKFDRALRSLAAHDAAGDWRDVECDGVAQEFALAWESDKSLGEALYNAGVVQLRCRHVDAARASFLRSLEVNPRLYQAEVRLTVLERRGDRERLDRAVEKLTKAAQACGFADLDVLVELAVAQMERGSLAGGGDGAASDFDLAAENLARASLIDEHSARVRNQLALLHLARAKQVAREKAPPPEAPSCVNGFSVPAPVHRPLPLSTQQLELAMGICWRAIREEPTYAPIHNTAGLVEFELRDAAAGIREFEQAVKLDPTYVAAYANLASALLSVRSFEAAERAYDQVLARRPDDYDAHLGRALARRGQITDENFWGKVKGAELDLDRCKQIDPDRPEAYYNAAFLAERFKAKGVPMGNVTSVLQDAAEQYKAFIAKADGHPQYAQQVRIAKDLLAEEFPQPRFLAERCVPTVASPTRAK
jgi:tetratricopeptide (TPR) repeat protein